MSPSRDGQAGFTLIEVMLAMVLMLVVAGATLAVFAAMERGTRDNQRYNESQQQVRVATDALAKRLRNLASPADSASAVQEQPIERANAQDLVFRAVSSDGTATADNPQNLQRYRYCLGPEDTLYVQRQTWTGGTPAVPADTACPGSGWTETRVAAQNVVNGTRDLFHYQLNPTSGTHSEQSSVAPADYSITVAVRTTMWVDPDPLRKPAETTLSTRVFLRNQNRPPVAQLDVSWLGNKVTLNASSSDDPEGSSLLYEFYDNGSLMPDLQTGAAMEPSTSALYVYKAPAGSHSYTVRVTDVGKLRASSSPPRTLSCNTTTCTSP